MHTSTRKRTQIHAQHRNTHTWSTSFALQEREGERAKIPYNLEQKYSDTIERVSLCIKLQLHVCSSSCVVSFYLSRFYQLNTLFFVVSFRFILSPLVNFYCCYFFFNTSATHTRTRTSRTHPHKLYNVHIREPEKNYLSLVWVFNFCLCVSVWTLIFIG